MSYNLIVTETAELHVLETCLYYEEQQQGLSDRFLDDLNEAYNKLKLHPQYYSHISSVDGIRDLCLHKFPFVVIYEIVNNDVIVLAVFNTHRKPIY